MFSLALEVASSIFRVVALKTRVTLLELLWVALALHLIEWSLRWH